MDSVTSRSSKVCTYTDHGRWHYCQGLVGQIPENGASCAIQMVRAAVYCGQRLGGNLTGLALPVQVARRTLVCLPDFLPANAHIGRANGLTERPMLLQRFHVASRQLLQGPPASFPPEQAAAISLLSARRVLPTIADLARYSVGDRVTLGVGCARQVV